MSNKAKAVLEISVLGLLGGAAILVGLPMVDHEGAPHWLMIAMAVAIPLCLGKIADRIWRRAA